MAILLKMWICPIGEASAGEGLRLQHAQQACFLFDNPFISENMSKVLIAFPIDVSSNILAEKLLVENKNNQGRIACMSKKKKILGGGGLENNPVGQSPCFSYRQILYRGKFFQTTPL